MSSQPMNRNRLGAIMLLLALSFGAILTASVAIAGVPTAQDKVGLAQRQLPPKQAGDQRNGAEATALPNMG